MAANPLKNCCNFTTGNDPRFLGRNNRALKSAIAARGSLASFNILKRLGGNENRFRCPLVELPPDGMMKTLSHIRLHALPILGNVFPSELIG